MDAIQPSTFNKMRLRGTYRMGAWVFGAAAGIVIIAALAIQFRIHIANEWQQYAPLPPATAPTSEDRIIVFAPHSDDETLGCGGMLAMAARIGAKVRIVLVTNGDGYRIAVAREYGTINASPEKCIRFAYKRQRETLNAISALGVPPGRVTFLGYPDRGIAHLWDKYWGSDTLYDSRSTDFSHSPYTNSFTPNAPYCGESLLSDIQKLLERDKPTDVYIPHPCDNHPDHYATYCFVTAAIAQLESEGCDFARKIRTHTYLVHRGDWPVPKGDHPNECLAPPQALARGDTKWLSLDLPADVEDMKRRAIRAYRTQTAMEKGFLTSFARRNDMFGSAPERKIRHVGNGAMVVDGDPEDWWGIPPVVVDPVGDYVVAGIEKGGDVRAIYLCADDSFLYIRLDCVRRLSKRITYTFNFRGIAGSDRSRRCSVSIKPPKQCSPVGTRWTYANNVLEVALPLAELAFDEDLFVQVTTKLVRITVDNTGWRQVRFDAVVRP